MVSTKSMKFFDLKGKKSFTTASYKCVTKSGRRMAIATTPTGGKAFRLMGKK